MEPSVRGASTREAAYDGIGRLTASYLVVPGSSEPSPGDISDDIVITQSETSYDSTSKVIFQTDLSRLYDATGTGGLNGPTENQPQARRSYLAFFLDGIGRTKSVA